MLQIDVFPRRIDRKEFTGRGTSSVLERMPILLQKFWLDHTVDQIHQSNARVGIVLGWTKASAYQEYLDKKQIAHEIVWRHRTQLTSMEIPCIWLELDNHGIISQLSFGRKHPEAFLRHVSYTLGECQ